MHTQPKIVEGELQAPRPASACPVTQKERESKHYIESNIKKLMEKDKSIQQLKKQQEAMIKKKEYKRGAIPTYLQRFRQEEE